MFRDNAEGGDNGPETVSLTNSSVSSQFTYLLAANDYDFESNGDSFLISCTTFNIQNNIQSYDFQKLSASSINITHQHYFFGCLTFQSSKVYQETFFIKNNFISRWGIYSYWCSIRNFLQWGFGRRVADSEEYLLLDHIYNYQSIGI